MARSRLTAVAVGAGLLLALPPTPSSAQDPTGSAPVTQPDRVRVPAGSYAPLDLTANDTDPDGDELAVCRVADVPAALQVVVQEGATYVVPKKRARGSYTFTYYACDLSYLTAGTATVVVTRPVPTLDIVPLDRPGKVRISNTYRHKTFRCTWGAPDDDDPDGKVVVRPRSSVVVTVHDDPVVVACEGRNVVAIAHISGTGAARGVSPRAVLGEHGDPRPGRS